MTRHKNATYESGSLTGSDGATSTVGTITLDTTSKAKGVNSAFVNTVVAYQRYDFTASPEVWVSAYIYPTSMSNNVRTFYLQNGLRFDFRSTGRLRLADAGGTAIGSDSAILTLNTLYRIGFHYKKGTGADGIVEAWVTAAGAPDAAFGAPFASNYAYTPIVDMSRLDVGNTSGALANAFYHDNLRIDTVSMPLDDVAGGTDTPMTVTRTVSNTLVITKGVGMPRSLVSTITPTVTKLFAGLKTIIQSVSNTLSLQRAINYTKSVAVTSTVTAPLARAMLVALMVLSTVTAAKTFAKIITLIVTGTASIRRAIARTHALVVTSTVTFAKGMVTLKNVTLAVNNTVSMVKNIGKPILQTVTATLFRNMAIPKNVLVSVQTILFLKKDFAFTKLRTVTSTITFIGGQLYFKTAEVIVNASLLIHKNILKPITVIESVVVSLQPKNIGKTLTTVVNTTLTALYGLANFKNISITVMTTVTRQLGYGKIVAYVQSSVVSVQKSFTLLIERTINAPVVLSVQKNISLTKDVVVNAIASISKTLGNYLTNTPFNKNVRALTLGLKNTTLNFLGKNTRSIKLQDTDES